MKSDIKKLWVDALRSGKYIQGKGRLKTVWHGGQTSYCCLGVLCEITEGVRWTEYEDETEEGGGQGLCATYKTSNGRIELPLALAIELGIKDQEESALIMRNDGFGAFSSHEQKSFPEIADYIEENL